MKKILSVLLAVSIVFSTLLSGAVVQAMDSSAATSVNINDNSPVTMTLGRRGHPMYEKIRTRTSMDLDTIYPTGRYVLPTDTITITVSNKTRDTPVMVSFAETGSYITAQCGWGSKHPLHTDIPLIPGVNIIKLSDIGIKSPTAVYLKNYGYTEDSNGPDMYKQIVPPTVTIEGGNYYPVYNHGVDNPDEFFEELKAYIPFVNSNNSEVIKGNGKANMADLSSENVVLATSATGAFNGISYDIERGSDVGNIMDQYEDLYLNFAKFSGYNTTDPTDADYMPRGQYILRTYTESDAGGLVAIATGYHVAYIGGENLDAGLYMELASSKPFDGSDGHLPYLISHEFGHQYMHSNFQIAEVTNDIYTLIAKNNKGSYSPNIKLDSEFVEYHNFNRRGFDWKGRYRQLFAAMVSQILNEFGFETFAKATKNMRNNNLNLGFAQDNIVASLSIATGYNLLPHFEYFGVKFQNATKNVVKNLPLYNKKTQYINSKSFSENAQPFSNPSVKPTASLEIFDDAEGIVVNVTIDESNDAVLLHEIYRDGKFIGVTLKSTFIDEKTSINSKSQYSVISYDTELNPSQRSDVASLSYDKSILQIEIDKFNYSLENENPSITYTKTSWDNYVQAFNKASSVLADSNPDNLTIYKANKNLIDARNALVKMSPDEKVNKYMLQVKVDKFDSDLSNGNIPKPNYSADFWMQYIQIFDEGSAILANSDATQDMVDSMVNNFNVIENHIANNTKPEIPPISNNTKPETPPVDETVDTSILQNLVDGFLDKLSNGSLNGDNYTLESWDTYVAAFDNAELVLRNDKATQKEIDSAVNKFVFAQNNLLLISNSTPPSNEKIDKSTITNLVNKFQEQLNNGTLNETDYTVESWTAFIKAFDNAKLVLSNDNVNQKEIDDAIKKVLNSKNALSFIK